MRIFLFVLLGCPWKAHSALRLAEAARDVVSVADLGLEEARDLDSFLGPVVCVRGVFDLDEKAKSWGF